ncbi:hypothetical protein [Bacillus chungangensis]|uniref:Formylmethanofuran dehydrogenase subunit E n=1 Tax=Bacillus chungangensis TaxID=587633 RepID=A0ABT9WMN9_9BACI|nr:hypothetical protein [Bacillus chungangensis]MDQ0174455.1 formylmethanofuran dehydrogenase subunit E [Bacillus chungangensis]
MREIISWQMSCVGCGNQLAEGWENVEGTPICRNCFDYGGDDE